MYERKLNYSSQNCKYYQKNNVCTGNIYTLNMTNYATIYQQSHFDTLKEHKKLMLLLVVHYIQTQFLEIQEVSLHVKHYEVQIKQSRQIVSMSNWWHSYSFFFLGIHTIPIKMRITYMRFPRLTIAICYEYVLLACYIECRQHYVQTYY